MPFHSWGLKISNPQLHSIAIQLGCHGDRRDVSDPDYFLKSRTTSLYASSFLFPDPEIPSGSESATCPWKQTVFFNISCHWRNFEVAVHILPQLWALPACDLRSSFGGTLWILSYTCIDGSQGCSVLWYLRSTHFCVVLPDAKRQGYTLVDCINGIAWLLFAQNPKSFGIYWTSCSRSVFFFSWLTVAS